jgi:hypothetical protein
VDARIRVFTVTGDVVTEFRADAQGEAVWDGRNASGNRVAGGVYLVVIQGEGGKKTIKIAVGR